MKYLFKHIFFQFLGAVLSGTVLLGCTNEIEQSQSELVVEDGIPVKVGFDLRSVSGSADEQINSVRILQVKNDIAGTIVSNKFYGSDSGKDFSSGIFSVELLSGDYQGIYVVVNENVIEYPGNTSYELDDINNLSDLEKATILMPYSDSYYGDYVDYNTYLSENNLPMFGKTMNVKIVPAPGEQSESNQGSVIVGGLNTGNTLHVSLKRLVCKLKISLETDGFSWYSDEWLFKIKGIPDKVSLFEDYVIPGVNFTFFQCPNNWYTPAGSDLSVVKYYYDIFLPAYTFESKNDKTKALYLEIESVDGNVKFSPFNFDEKPYDTYFGHDISTDYTLHQNTAYDLMVSIYDWRPYLQLSPARWERHEVIDVPTVGTTNEFLQIPDNVVLEWHYRMDNLTYYTFLDYKSSSAPTLVRVGSIEMGTNQKVNEIFPYPSDWMYSVQNHIDHQNYTEYAPDALKRGRFQFFYRATSGDRTSIPITMKVGNITKTFYVHYGNGPTK